MSREVPIAMGTPMEGFFDREDIVAEAMASTFDATQGAPVEAPIPPPKTVPIEESIQAEKVGESVPIPAEIHSQKVTPLSASQPGSASLATLPVISTSDPFVILS